MKASDLTGRWVFATLLALVSCRGVCFSQQTVSHFDAKAADESVELIEARTARASAEQRIRDLELEIERLRRENQSLKSKYAGLYVKTYDLLERLRRMELAGANLIHSGSASGTGMNRDDALEALDLTIGRMTRLQEACADYRKYVSSLAGILQASDAAKSELARHGESMQKALDAVARPLVMASKRNVRMERDRLGASVVSVDEELGLVVLDRGSLSGVRSGRMWFLSGANGVILAKLQTVECRAEFCAAVVVEGELSRIRPGAVVAPLVKVEK